MQDDRTYEQVFDLALLQDEVLVLRQMFRRMRQAVTQGELTLTLSELADLAGCEEILNQAPPAWVPQKKKGKRKRWMRS